MRITRARIFGFGKWVDYEFEFPKEGPTVIFGINESGKSTFHQFILFILFGMQPKERKKYQPKTSSKLGGQLVVEDDKVGSFTIERLDDANNGKATCLGPTGEMYDEDWLRERLHGMDKETFQSIFSFTALDLNAIKNLKEEELRDVLLSIGLSGSSSIYQLEKELDNQLGNLFKPYGKKPELNKQLNHLEETFHELTKMKEEEATYQEKMAKAEKIKKYIQDIQEKQSQLEMESKWIGKQLTAFPLLEEHQDLLNRKRHVQDELPFPTNGIKRLEHIKDALRPLESEDAVLENHEVNYRNNIDEMSKEELPEALVNELLGKQELQEVHRKLEEQIQEVNEKIQKIKTAVLQELAELQIDFSEAELDELSLPFYIEETWKQLKEEHERLEQEKMNLKTEKNALTDEQSFLKSRLQHEEETALSEKEMIALEQKINEGKELEQLERLYHSTREQQYNYKKDVQQKGKRSKLVFWIGMILSIIGIAVALRLEGTFYFIFSILLLLLSIGQRIVIKWNHLEMEKLLQAPLETEIKETLSNEERNRLERQWRIAKEQQAEIDMLQSDLNRTHIHMLQMEEKERNLQEKKRRHTEKLEEQYTIYPFLERINHFYWPEYFNRLKNLYQLHQERQEHQSTKDNLETKHNKLESEVISFVQGQLKEPIEDIYSCFTAIDRLVEKGQDLKNRKTHVNELIETTEAKRTDMKKRITVHENEMNELFRIANTKTEEDFYGVASYLTEKEQVEEAIERNKKQLNSILQEGEWKALVLDDINEGTLVNRKQVIEQEQVEFHQELENLRSEFAEVNAELKRLEGSEATSQKMHQFEMEKEKLNALAKEWSILKIEKEVLAETKGRYQEKYLSKVMTETTELLSLITGGGYVAVYAPEDKQTFQVVASNGLRYGVEELSQGAMNQLYVSLRLAISKVMTEKQHVPFLVDDAFVHFDAVRVKRMIEVLAEVSVQQQVIMFTCKSDVKEACDKLEIPIISV